MGHTKNPQVRQWPLADRIPPVPVNSMGLAPSGSGFHLPRTRDALSPALRERFDAQMEAWRAGCALTIAISNAAKYDAPVPPGLFDRWEAARAALHPTPERKPCP